MRRLALVMSVCTVGLVLGAVPTLAADSFTFTTFDAPFFGTVNTDANGMNIHGQVVGGSADAKESAASFHGYLREPDGSLTSIDFPFFPLSFGTVASDINVHGVIVGGYRDVAGRHCFVLEAGLFTTIDIPFPHSLNTTCAGINAIGQIVGVYNDANVPDPRANRGFLLSRDTFSMVDVPGVYNTLVRRINNRGQIVGFYRTFKGGPTHGFLFEKGVYSTIDFPNAKETRALDISDNGQVVGDYIDSADDVHAYSLIDNDFVTVAIPGVIQNTGGHGFMGQIDSPGIYAVNDRGQIAGISLGTDGHFHGFVGTPAPF
jgi:uncharacterized membrane protein